MTNKEIAKEIISKWGYEEEYWWKPIEEALNQKDNAQLEELKISQQTIKSLLLMR